MYTNENSASLVSSALLNAEGLWKADKYCETLTSSHLPARDGFDLKVAVEQDYEWDIYDSGYQKSEADLAAWNRMDWLFVGVVVTASRDGQQLGDVSIWQLPQAVMSDGVRVDVLGSNGPFHANYELLVAEAIAHAIDTLRRSAANESHHSDFEESDWAIPTVEKLDKPDHTPYRWQVTWPDGAGRHIDDATMPSRQSCDVARTVVAAA